ncbi:decaprenyl-phosphate phosphoribosyltransferase [Pseudoramibacter sp.]|jgi:decaprenyl-phosphate phosphoribosyltransferase|uniref:decaprenyl-phosphate phosphoribosyltransferase n=1 Tax=Pseudoramibacter sp. TaxID=2034862 RepID=UPI0025F92967|nr:decaprenyl-phosphate phosphoribosyltransferase [Pseudoramibacter sp.]MCH4071764.1 decaprenyl-phosphate phosphoribosyltransferase [Pseudoramibacter sp.]MCH4105532.1 decaprenyl-phosphate phosphoribosyltransferase [Pseudoramibacter sp.]
MKKYLKLLRTRHYLKNLLVFIPIFFNQTLFSGKFINALLGFLAFCMISSAVYIINDIKDVEKDRHHPTKRFRPIASGAVSVQKAKTIGIICLIFSIILTSFTKLYISIIFIMLYFVLNILYSGGLKNKPLVDVVILASGFILRVIYGAYLTGVPISGWLYLTIWTGAFYMGLGKRRNEIEKQKELGETRTVLKYYTYGFLDKNMYVCVALANVFYALWAVGHDDQRFLWSAPILMIVLMKYSLDIEGNSDGDPIEVILHDKVLIALISVFAAYLFFILYF